MAVIPVSSRTMSLSQVRKKFTVKDLAYDYKKVNQDMVKQLQQQTKISKKVKNALKRASQERIDSYIDELISLLTQLKQTNELDLVILARASCCLLDGPVHTRQDSLLPLPGVSLFDRPSATLPTGMH